MEIYYYYILALTSLSFLLRGWACVIALATGCSLFLLWLPSTGYDYFYYKQAYDNAYFSQDYPWFKTTSILTAEPLYRWYSAAISVLLPLDFPGFLALNFLACLAISWWIFNKLEYFDLDLFWIAYLPVIFPTIFYFSPRSSVPYFLLFAALVFLSKDKLTISVILCFLAISFHSQYILYTVFILSIYLGHRYGTLISGKSRWMVGILVLTLMGFGLLAARVFVGTLSSILSFLPSAGVAVTKLHYLDLGESSMRLTSVLSVFIYPAMYFLLIKKKASHNIAFLDDPLSDKRFCYLLGVTVLFGTVVNIVFYYNSHLSGRLSRFSDFLSMGILLPGFFKMYFTRDGAILALLGFATIAPFLYTTVYGR